MKILTSETLFSKNSTRSDLIQLIIRLLHRRIPVIERYFHSFVFAWRNVRILRFHNKQSSFGRTFYRIFITVIDSWIYKKKISLWILLISSDSNWWPLMRNIIIQCWIKWIMFQTNEAERQNKSNMCIHRIDKRKVSSFNSSTLIWYWQSTTNHKYHRTEIQSIRKEHITKCAYWTAVISSTHDNRSMLDVRVYRCITRRRDRTEKVRQYRINTVIGEEEKLILAWCSLNCK